MNPFLFLQIGVDTRIMRVLVLLRSLKIKRTLSELQIS